jgi:hypothetical protein
MSAFTDESILAKVRGLMNKAADAACPEAEAETCRRLADKLMTKYALDAWMLAQESEQSKMPEVRMFDFNWWKTGQFRDQLYTMFGAMAKHCRCHAVISKWGRDGDDYIMPVCGLPSDLDWFDLLFTNVMISMLGRVDPRAEDTLSVNENMARMREAGMPWGAALNRLALAGIVPSLAQEAAEAKAAETGEDVDYNDNDKFRWAGNGRTKLFFSKRVYERTISAYRKWCAQTGHPQSYVSQATFRRNFADGFAAEIRERLYRMRRESESAYDGDHEAGSMALAVRDIGKIVDEIVWQTYPDLRPHPSNCDCNACHYCFDSKCQRPNCVARRDYKPIRTRARAPKEEKVDWAARDAGRAAGREVNLSNQPSERISNQKGGLPHGDR